MAIIEMRGIWLTTTDSKVLRSKQRIAEAMDFLAETGFNVVFPVVWNKAVTLYPSRTMQQTFGVEIDPMCVGRDPLEEVVVEARRVGLKVIPWFEYGFASSYNLNGGMLLQKKPEWAARDCNGNLLKKNGFEWLNALDPQVQEFLLNLVLEVVKNYDVDGTIASLHYPLKVAMTRELQHVIISNLITIRPRTPKTDNGYSGVQIFSLTSWRVSTEG